MVITRGVNMQEMTGMMYEVTMCGNHRQQSTSNNKYI